MIVTIPPLTNPVNILLIQATTAYTFIFSIKSSSPKLIVPKVHNTKLIYSSYFFLKKNIILPYIKDERKEPKLKQPNINPIIPSESPLVLASYGKKGKGNEKAENTKKSNKRSPHNV